MRLRCQTCKMIFSNEFKGLGTETLDLVRSSLRCNIYKDQ